MPHWKLTLSYNGSAFHGWQVQPNLPTIQGTLATALHRLTGETVLPQGSGRTDTGVHALAQVASFTLAAPIPPKNLLRALNRTLPPSIRILSAEPVPPTFHARHSALRKTYEYRIFDRSQPDQPAQPDRICSPFLAPFVWDCPFPLALEPMQQAATLLLGTHDFTSFAASDPDLTLRSADREKSVILSEARSAQSKDLPPRPPPHSRPDLSTPNPPATNPNPTKTLTTSTLTRENDLLLYRVTGSGFLHHMVRNIVGTLVEVGRGALPSTAIPAILAARNRSAAGPTSPPHGLFLISVHYPNH
jgi:tRNA pseudouridine38-40 synthase